MKFPSFLHVRPHVGRKDEHACAREEVGRQVRPNFESHLRFTNCKTQDDTFLGAFVLCGFMYTAFTQSVKFLSENRHHSATDNASTLSSDNFLVVLRDSSNIIRTVQLTVQTGYWFNDCSVTTKYCQSAIDHEHRVVKSASSAPWLRNTLFRFALMRHRHSPFPTTRRTNGPPNRRP